MLSRRDLFKLVGSAGAASAAGALVVAEPEPVRRAYSFVGGWQRDWRYPEWDARHWGVVGDGVTDDTAALQRALDNVSYLGLHGGNYLVTAPLELKQTVRIGDCRFTMRPKKPERSVLTVKRGSTADIRWSSFDCGGTDCGVYVEDPGAGIAANAITVAQADGTRSPWSLPSS